VIFMLIYRFFVQMPFLIALSLGHRDESATTIGDAGMHGTPIADGAKKGNVPIPRI
jgi:hypothetical protein